MAGIQTENAREPAPCTSGRASGGSASSSGVGRDGDGRWRDVVLLERRSERRSDESYGSI